VVAVVQAVSVAVVEAWALASVGAALARSCDAASLQAFGVICDRSFSVTQSVRAVAADCVSDRNLS
jgi:hypothetical protein